MRQMMKETEHNYHIPEINPVQSIEKSHAHMLIKIKAWDLMLTQGGESG